MFRNLKKKLFPGRYYHKRLDRQLGQLLNSLKAPTAAPCKMAIESMGRFRQLIAFLENPATAPTSSAGTSPATAASPKTLDRI